MALNTQKQTMMIEGSGIKCKLPLVTEYNTSIARFRNQIMAQILRDLQRSCIVEPLPPTPPITPTPTPKEKVLLSKTTHPIELLKTAVLDHPAETINSVNTSIRNPVFKIIGFSSIEALITGEAVSLIDYLGIDGQSYRQQLVQPLSQVVTIPGDFPTDASLEGEIVIDSFDTINEYNSSFTQIDSIRIELHLSGLISVYALEVPSANQRVVLSSTSHSMNLPVTLDFAVLAPKIISTNVVLQHVFFDIVGFSSVQIRVSGEVVLEVSYLGIDRLEHNDQEVMPFVNVFTIAGNFPSNALVDGSLVIDNVVDIPEEDPSFLALTGLTSNLFVTAVIEISAIS